jgi:hypothetical protein
MKKKRDEKSRNSGRSSRKRSTLHDESVKSTRLEAERLVLWKMDSGRS